MKNSLKNKKVAIVCDWIKDWGGAEIVLSQLIEIFPQADIFTSIFYQQDTPLFENYEVVKSGKEPKEEGKPKIYTSFIQKIPVLNRSHKLALPLRPAAFEGFDVSQYDIVISSTSAESKGVITKPHTLQICYCHTPTRYFWSHYEEYQNMMEFGILNPLIKYIFPKVIEGLREWDFVAAQRPDYYIANSQNSAERIAKYYERESEVIYPSLDVVNIPFSEEKDDYYFYAGRVIPYKKFDLIVETFNQNGLPLKIVANTKNNLSEELRRKSAPNIEWIYETDNTEINKLHSRAKAFLFPPEEDFGLVPIAAQATGTPVIAYGKGGALETVIARNHPTIQENYPVIASNAKQSQNKPHLKPLSYQERGGEKTPTGIFFDEQTPESLQKAIDEFESMTFDAKAIRKHAQQFDKKVFQEKIVKFIEEKL